MARGGLVVMALAGCRLRFGSAGCEEGALFLRGALASRRVHAGVAALAQAGKGSPPAPTCQPSSISGHRHEHRNLISFS